MARALLADVHDKGGDQTDLPLPAQIVARGLVHVASCAIAHAAELDRDARRVDDLRVWPGEFVRRVDGRRAEVTPGRARFWLRPRVPLLVDEPVSATARALSILDIANGITPRRSPATSHFRTSIRRCACSPNRG
jgi:hypothetical protein